MLRVGSSLCFSANFHVVRSLRLSATFCNECGEKAYNNVNFIMVPLVTAQFFSNNSSRGP